MKKFTPYHLAFLFLLCPLLSQTQSTFTAAEITLSAEEQRSLDRTLGTYTAFYLDLDPLYRYVNGKRGTTTLNLQIDTIYNWTLQLQPKEMYTTDCQVEIHSDTGSYFIPCGPTNLYTGTINDDAEGDLRMFLSQFKLWSNLTIRGQQYYLANIQEFLPDYVGENVFLVVEKGVVEEQGETVNSCTKWRIHESDQDRYLEVGMDVDFNFYNKFKNNNPDYYISRVRGETGNQMAKTTSIYWDYFDIDILVAHENIWTTTDPYNTSPTSQILSALSTYWQTSKQCVRRDWVHLFSAKNLGFDGKASGKICEYFNQFENSAYTVSNHRYGHKWRFGTIAHELGHCFKALHLESDSQCAYRCDDNPPHPIMCTTGVNDSTDPDKHFFVTPSQEAIISTMIANVECLEEPFIIPADCPRCAVEFTVDADNISPTLGCSSEDIIEFTLNVCNDCEPRTINKIHFQFNHTLELAEPGNLGDFTSLISIGGLSALKVINVPLEALECKSFKVKMKVVDINPNGTIYVQPNIFYDAPPLPSNTPNVGWPIYWHPLFNYEIDGTTTPYPTVSSLIDSDDLPESPANCADAAYQKIRITGTLEVDQDYNIGGNSNIVMDPGSQIVVKSGAELRICGGSRLYGCNEMWKGITVEDGGSLILDNVTIEDAEFAVNALEGSHLGIYNSHFADNHVGIHVPSSTSGSAQVVGMTSFGNTFTGRQALLPSYPNQVNYTGWPFAGLQVHDLQAAMVGFELILNFPGAGPFTVPFPPNEFKSLANGIVMDNSSLTIINTNFDNIHSYQGSFNGKAIKATGDGDDWLIQRGMGDDMVSFNNCIYGIHALGMNMDIHNNKMREVQNGILLYNSPNRSIHIHDNDIESMATGLYLTQNAPLTQGLIEDNIITMMDNSNANGIWVFEVAAEESGLQIFNNEITLKEGKRGIYHQGGLNSLIQNNVITTQSLYAFQGICLEDSPEAWVKNNDIIGIGSGDPQQYWNKIGIDIVNSPSTIVECNSVDKTTIGINFFGDCGSGNRLKLNKFWDHKEGLVLGRHYSDGTVDGTVTFAPQIHAGNHWEVLYDQNSGNTSGVGAQHLGSPDIGQFIVDEVENQHFLPSTEVQDGGWFEAVSTPEITIECRRRLSPLDGLHPKAANAFSQNKVQMTAYPNPAKNSLTVDYKVEQAESLEISIINSLGSTIKIYPLSPDSHQLQLDISHLPAGIYQLLLSVNNQPTAYQAIVVTSIR